MMTQSATFGSIRVELDGETVQVYGPAGFVPDCAKAQRTAVLFAGHMDSALDALACALHQQAAAQRGLASLGLGR